MSDVTESITTSNAPSSAAAAAFGAASSGEGLVFGEVDEEEIFSTPLAVTRASSRAADYPSVDGTHYSPQTASPAALDAEQGNTAALAAAALQKQLAASSLTEPHANDIVSSLQDSTDAAQQAVNAADSTALSSSSTGSSGADDGPQTSAAAGGMDAALPLPGTAQAAAAAAATAADTNGTAADGGVNVAAQQQPNQASGDNAAASTTSKGSGLLSLAELTLNNNSSSSNSSREQQDVTQQQQPQSPGSHSDTSATASDSAAAAEGAAAAVNADTAASSAAQAACAAAPGAAVSGRSPSNPAATEPSISSSPKAQQHPAPPIVPQDQPIGHSSSPSTRMQPLSSSSAAQHAAQSSPVSPLRSQGSAGLERAASWQLQHAAAAAAGTATHPAPPRSDIDLAKLSNTPASPHGESGWAAWQQRRRHFFVLTAAGKPVYSRHGDEQALAGFMAVIQALISVMSDQGDVIHSITVGSSSIEFMLRGQLFLVAASSRGEAQQALRRQLELLYQSVLMVATGGIEKLLTRSPGYDVQQLLAGAKPSMDALISGFGDCPGWMTASVEPAPTAAADRQLVNTALQEAVKACECLFGVLLVCGRVVAVVRGAAAPSLNVFDLLLLINFSTTNESLRHNETFVPVCLPNFQPNAFVHAYVNCLDNAVQQQQQQQQQQPAAAGSIPQQQDYSSSSSSSGTFLLLLSGSADAFHKLSAAQCSFVSAVTSGPGGGVLGRIQAAAVQPGCGRVRVEALPAPLGGSVGSTPLWHAVIRYPQRHQHITLAYPQQLFAARSQVKQLVRSYCRLYCSVYGQLLNANATATAAGPFGSGGISGSSSQSHAATAAAAGKAHKLLWVTSNRWVTGVLVDRDVEVYATFDPLTEKDLGLKMAVTLQRLFGDKARRQDLLVPGL